MNKLKVGVIGTDKMGLPHASIFNTFEENILSGISEKKKTINSGLKKHLPDVNILQLFKNSFKKLNIKFPIVMTLINFRGYDMNPSKGVVEIGIKEYNGEIIAKNIVGRGFFSQSKVYSYLHSFNNKKYCVIGVSPDKNLREIMEIPKIYISR